ncbi:MAG TPA: ATP-binding protein [Candidatus Melainabacteria bacterium]|nr:ATP-binding protein [Candidatus Melainabacteria bacterium]
MLETRDSRRLFKQFKNGGLAFIKALADRKDTENEVLDFKLAKNGDGRLEPEDKANLARALSGFANTRGGLLVWGIYCAENENGEDCVQSYKPIANVAAFKSGIQSCIHQLTAPAVQGVELFCIPDEDQVTAGYLVVHVPASSIPVESVFKKCKGFYERAGTSFVEMTGNRLVQKAKHRPLGKLLIPYMRAFAIYSVILGVLIAGLCFGWGVGRKAAYNEGFEAGKQAALKQSAKESAGEKRPKSPSSQQ